MSIIKSSLLKHIEAIADIFPGNLHWGNTENIVLGANAGTLNVTGAKTSEKFINTIAWDLYPKEMAEVIIRHNDLVFSTLQPISKEIAITDISTGEVKHFIDYKAPLFDDDHRLFGVLGLAILLDDKRRPQSVNNNYRSDPNHDAGASHFEKLVSSKIEACEENEAQQKKIYQEKIKEYLIKHYCLSPRQMICLYWLLRGYTDLEIANFLQLSPRTVESYINVIKSKLYCDTRRAITQKAFAEGFHDLPLVEPP